MSIVEWLRKQARDCRFGVWELTGSERGSGDDLRLVFAGQPGNKNYIVNLAFAGEVTESCLGRKWLWDIWRIYRNPQRRYSLLITELNKGWRGRCGLQGFYVPVWVEGEIVFDTLIRQMESSEHVKSDLRRIRKNGLDYEVTQGPAAITDFYYRMYLPHTLRAHGNEAVPHSLDAVMAKVEQSDLLLIKRDGHIIAGEMIVYESGGARFWCSGVVDGNHDFVKAGALAALYYYRYLYLSHKGYSKVHVGASRAFLNDGVLQYKKKWGMRVIGDRNSGFMISVLRPDRGVRSFLKNNPFMHESDGVYHAAVFADAEPAPDEDRIREVYRRYCLSGIARLDYFCLDTVPLDARVPDELTGCVEIKLASG